MLFSSIPFLYYFLPVILIIYFVLPKKWNNIVLLCSSLLFYGWGEPKHLWLMVISITMGYLLGLGIDKYRGKKTAKYFLILSVGFHLGMLGYFKYTNFFLENVNGLLGKNFNPLKIALPIGISFYTFQILSYTVDVYRGSVCVQKNIIDLAAYITMFPQLIAGPIVRYSDIEESLKTRTYGWEQTADGIERFLIGLSKKILIANVLGELCALYKNSNDISVLYTWLYAIAFMLQIYYDFSGYSDMAIGLGNIFGFHFPENFRYPYVSKSLTEFWRRWHISLGSWFRDYVYIPLGGNRVSKRRWYVNIMSVWLLTGFWHGADWNFILWGMFFAFILMIEKHALKKQLDASKIWCHIYVLFLIMISFMIFNAESVTQAIVDLKSLWGLNGIPMISKEAMYYMKSYSITIVIAMIFAVPVIPDYLKKWKSLSYARVIMWMGLLLINTAFLVAGSFNPFLYFRF